MTLAADEWQGSGDPLNASVVEWILEDLNLRGLVIYKLGEHGLFVDIRATPDGYDLAGYPPPITVRSSNHHHTLGEVGSSKRTGDMTDFRNIRSWHTWGGPIEKESIEDHLRRFPDHISIHDIGERMLNSIRDAIWPPSKLDQEPTLEERVVYEFVKETTVNSQMTAQEYADANNVSIRTAYKRMREESARTMGTNVAANHKVVALEALNALPTKARFDQVRAQMAKFDLVVDAHSLTHILWSLQKEQLIKFRERKNSAHNTESVLDGIRLLPRGVARIQEYRARGLSPLTTPIKGVAPARRDFPQGPQNPTYIAQKARENHVPIDVIKGTDRAAIPPELLAEALQDEDKSTSPVKETLTEAAEEKAESTEKPAEVAEKPAEAKPFPKIIDVLDVEHDYPMIYKLMNKRTKAQQAAELLAEAGMEELGLQALSSVSYSPFEEEVLRLMADLAE